MANTALPVTAPEGTSTYRFLTAPVLLVITPLPVRVSVSIQTEPPEPPPPTEPRKL